ncbi:hypothetical protein GQR58_029450 [Nymphon striatum]|nr:hypothetical protein GQR58_029450 [Nymphon striatum]
MRVWPAVSTVLNVDKLSKNHKQALFLQSWRSMLISSVARKYPTDDMMAYAAAYAAARAADAAARAADAAARAAYTAYTADAANAANAAADAAYAAADAAYAANAAAGAAGAAGAANAAYAAISCDCHMLLNGNANKLEGVPLWLKLSDEAEQAEPVILNDDPISGVLAHHEHHTLLKDAPWQLMIDWYRAWLPANINAIPRNIFNEEKSLELAHMPDEFWQIEDNRSADQIVTEIAEVLGYGDKLDPNILSPTQDVEIQSYELEKGPAEKIARNRLSIRLQLSGIQISIDNERELLGAKPNEPDALEDWERRSKFLDKMNAGVTSVIDALPSTANAEPTEEDKKAASVLLNLATEFEDWIKVNKKDVVDWTARLSSATLFTGLLAAAGATMPVATPIILAMTCGSKARDIILGNKPSNNNK